MFLEIKQKTNQASIFVGDRAVVPFGFKCFLVFTPRSQTAILLYIGRTLSSAFPG